MTGNLTKLPAVFFCCLMLIGGAFLIYGTYVRLPMLVGPPKRRRFFYSQAASRAVFGERTLVAFTYLLGALFMAAGVTGLWNGLR